MCTIDPRSVSELSCDPVRSVSDKLVHGQIFFSDRRAEKDSFMFGAGASTSNLCPPGMMCKLDCLWVSPYLFVSLGRWPFGIRVQSDLAVIRAYCREPGGSHPAPLREGVGCFPDNIGPVKCPGPTPDFAPGFTCRPSDLITLYGVVSACRGFSVLFEQPLLRQTSSGQGELIKECFSFDVSMLSDPRVLSVQHLSQPVLSDPGDLITEGVQFVVSLPALSPGGDSVRPGLHLLVSGDAGCL